MNSRGVYYMNIYMKMEASSQLFPMILKGEKEHHAKVEDIVLNMVLPVSMAGSINQEAKQRNAEELEMTEYNRRLHFNLEILTGSTAEGLGLPEVTKISQQKQWTSGPDEDVKYVFTSLLVDNHHRKAFAIMETKHASPGFTRLVFNSAWLVKHRNVCHKRFTEQNERKTLMNHMEYTNRDGYILRKKLTGILRNSLRSEIHSAEKERYMTNSHERAHTSVHFSQHGPAITVDIKDHFRFVHHSKDYVVAMPCPQWPAVATEWLTRMRVWPSRLQIKQIAKRGCHIVPKGHHSNKDPTEFIISFSVTEKHVAMCLNIYQKRVYMLLKFLFKYHLNKANRGLTTYHLKTTLFRRCEYLPADQWTEFNPYKCLQLLLHDLEGYVAEGILPHYFIKESNLIDFMTKPTRRAIVADLQAIQKHCWYTILELTDRQRFCWLSKDILLPRLLQPVVSQQEKELTHGTIQNTVAIFVSKLLQKSQTYVAISLLCGTTNCEVLPPVGRIIACTEAAIESNTLAADCKLSLHGLLATLYHQLARELAEQNQYELCEEHLAKSSEIFESICPRVQDEIWIIAEYYNLLSAADKYTEIVRHFIRYLHKSGSLVDLYAGGVYTRVEGHNNLTTDETFITEGQMAEFIVPSTAYLFFKVYKSAIILCKACQGSKLLEMRKFAGSILKNFKQWAWNKITKFQEICDEHIIILLALCEKLNNRDTVADRLFREAMDYNGVYKPNPDQLMVHNMPLKQLRHLSGDHLCSHPYPQCKPYSRQAVRVSVKHICKQSLEYRRRNFILKEYVHF